ncbi:bifunctional tetrahydrofolate synthase/dihydrofolate synthase [Hahella sp. CCB-MM4]|uniref:bifunctional tetrahydrofolate synthase/dihydrofolate synthase n=1 Tax=Hahella sp. (strain CCB-MM4) TaxID=1926491 RepID=UPI000BDCDA3A|nr:bifunctional tetrahydrofolate synthase/dihydrofolate synthase [Hahella sp. CCB-MM4]OZG73658.1 bifunctional tetrahydrofolate synthase/dihydrofolate synthase [Hahella sp. CCB-MM4]
MSDKSLDQWLDDVTKLHDQVIEMGLDRVADVASRLLPKHFPQAGCKIVTVAGTNGKGSTVAALEGLALQAGWKVGAYTSPHIRLFNERVRIQGEDLDDDSIVRAFEKAESVREGVALTYFEFTTLVAFAAFVEAGLDLWILEVGLGGRLDAVNIVDPDLAVITTIDVDHQEWLGDNREMIGREKAGIFRPGIPVLLGDADMPVSVFDYADKQSCEVLQWQRDYSLEHDVWKGASPEGKPLEAVLAALPDIPAANIATAIQSAVMIGIPLDVFAGGKPFPLLNLMGRFQKAGSHPEIVLDVAHNPHAARYLAGWLKEHPVEGPTVAVFSALKDKDIDGVVSALSGSFKRWHIFELEDVRACQLDSLEEFCRSQRANVSRHDGAADALSSARLEAGELGRVVVFGSFFTVAAILETGIISL